MIVILLAISGSIIFVCTNISLKLKFKYPTIECADIKKEYLTSGVVSSQNYKQWQQDSVNEYTLNHNYELEGKATHYQGNMQCFCQYNAEQDKSANTEYEYSTTTTDSKTGKKTTTTHKIALCKVYFSDKFWSKFFGTMVSFVIIAINTVLRLVIIKGITWVGEDTNSE